MSRVDSTYSRRERDLYETPDWVTACVVPHLPMFDRYHRYIWEPACGTGAMVRVLADAGYHVRATDIVDGVDFLQDTSDPYSHDIDGIVTNPPYTLAEAFIQRAIDLMQPRQGFVAMLLSSDFDSAACRRPLFKDCPIFAKTVVLTRRIVWFERTDGKRAAPSENHRWYIWDWQHKGPPTIGYAP